MWLARKHTRAAYAEIGEYFGHRSHSTVISAQKQVHRWMNARETVRMAHSNCDVQEAVRRVESQIRAGPFVTFTSLITFAAYPLPYTRN